jgi:microsomal epoxide hydrolase
VAIPHVTGAQGPDPAAIRPFTIHVPDAVLVDLKARLANARIPDALQGEGWTHGTDVRYLKELVAYWRDRFDWREQERRLNRLEQFTTTIDGLTVHFIHRRSKQPNALPLLITHGWPGSFVEFTKIVGPLTDPVAYGGRPDDGFDVVIPSIPGYAFSERPRESGYDPARMAAIEAKLMARLGYQRYGAQGGDWGAIINTELARNDAPHVVGLHLNMCRSAPPPGGDPTAGLSDAERARLKVRDAYQAEETGYLQIQGTKPQTLGIALNDSPVGLAAWIVEKFQRWCDCDGNPEKVFTKDELLTNIMIYWVTGTITSSTRLYCESRRSGRFGPGVSKVEVPTGCALFPGELFRPPRKWAEHTYNVVQWTEMPAGGHFAAMEEPELLVNDIRSFARALR